MNQPPPKPKPINIYEMTLDELRTQLVRMVNETGVYQFSPANYADEIARREEQESAKRANAIAERAARIASRSIWATIASAVAAAVSAGAAVLALNHQAAASPPPQPIPVYGYCWDDPE